MKKAVLILLAVIVSGCSSVRYTNLYEGATDPTYNFRKGSTIGFVPTYWTTRGKEAGKDELIEKQFYAFFKKELERRGLKLVYIQPDQLEEQEDKNISYKSAEYTELALVVDYGVNSGEVTIPGQAYGGWGTSAGYVGSTQSYDVQVYGLYINCSLFAGPPEYKQRVWYGQALKGRPQPDLLNQAQWMIINMLARKFPRIR